MDVVFHTLQDFMVHTKNITYILMVPALLGFIGFWFFLVKKSEDE